MKPLVSIIIPTKNRVSLTKKTISNILNQNYRNIEVIIVDDHSTDNTISHLGKIEDKRIKVIKNAGVGPGAARNTGMSIAKGRFIKFFDSDDLMTQNLISSQVDSLLNKDCKAVYSPFIKVSLTDSTFEPIDEVIHYKPWHTSSKLRHLMLQTFFTPIPCYLFERSVLEDNESWPEGYISYEDWHFLWNLSERNLTFCHTNEGCFFYVVHGDQSTENAQTIEEKKSDMNELLIPKLIMVYKSNNERFLTKFYAASSLAKLKKDISSKNRHCLSSFDFLYLSACLLIYKIIMKTRSYVRSTKWPKIYGSTSSVNISNYYLSKLRIK